MAQIVEAAKDVLGLAKKVRYAVVALGDISQRAFMPGVGHTHNSEMVALVTSDPEKAKDLCKKYGIKDSYSYEQFDQMLKSKTVDAIYLATPNFRHAEFAVPALKAGVHVLLEKPMEITSEKCKEIMEAQKASGAKLMIAYRLHFEPATIATIERVRNGDLGQVHFFTSSFSQFLKPSNHRAQNGEAAGPLFDLGVYPINTVRNLFGAEPIQVQAVGVKHAGTGFSEDFCDTVSATLLFPDNRLAQFTVSYFANSIDEFSVCGTQGSIRRSPAYMYTEAHQFAPMTIVDKKSNETFKFTDHFGGQLKYFSDCILKGENPEPDGEEGWCDVRIVEALIRSLQKGGAPEKLEPYTRKNRILSTQVQTLGAVSQPDDKQETNTESPAYH